LLPDQAKVRSDVLSPQLFLAVIRPEDPFDPVRALQFDGTSGGQTFYNWGNCLRRQQRDFM
jgi:hypothetical protein